jgi:hypothetical protein
VGNTLTIPGSTRSAKALICAERLARGTLFESAVFGKQAAIVPVQIPATSLGMGSLPKHPHSTKVIASSTNREWLVSDPLTHNYSEALHYLFDLYAKIQLIELSNCPLMV